MRILRLAVLLAAGVVVVRSQNPNTAAFPGAIATDTNLLVASNNGVTTLLSAMTNSQTTIPMAAGTNFIAPTALTIDAEIVVCTTLTSATFSGCTRGAQGTTPATHAIGAVVFENQVAWYHNQVAAEIKAIETALGVSLANIPGPLTLTNDTGTGTVVNQLAKANASGHAIKIGTGDTAIPVFVVVSGAGASGSATLGTSGLQTCQTDAGGATTGHFIVASSATAGRCADIGTTAPTSGWVIGQAQATAGANANVVVLLSQGYNAAAGGSSSSSFTVTNDNSTGTALHQLAKINASGNAVSAGTGDTAVPVYVVTGGAGTSGSATLTYGGLIACQTDGAGATTGDFIGASTSTGGRCMDLGASAPTSGWVIGIAQTSAGANANANVALVQGYNATTGSGITNFSQLNNGRLVRTSSTVITIDPNCSSTLPCPVSTNGVVHVFTTSATCTINSGGPLARVYIDVSGTRSCDVASGSITCSGCTATSAGAFPAGSFPYGSWAATSGTWNSTPTAILAAPFTAPPPLGAGTCFVPNAWSGSVDPTCAELRKVCMIVVGSDNGSALANADLGQQGFQCYIPSNATVIEVDVGANAGTPSVIPADNHAGSLSNLVSAALATAASGGRACSNVGGGLGLDGLTTCSATLQNISLLAGDSIDLASGGVAGGTAARMSVAVIWVAQ